MQDDLKAGPQEVLTRVCHFLGAPAERLVTPELTANVTSEWRSGVARQAAAQKFRRVPFYRAIKSLLPAPVKARLLSRAAAGSDAGQQAFSPDLRDELRDSFRDPNRRLAARLGALPDSWDR